MSRTSNRRTRRYHLWERRSRPVFWLISVVSLWSGVFLLAGSLFWGPEGALIGALAGLATAVVGADLYGMEVPKWFMPRRNKSLTGWLVGHWPAVSFVGVIAAAAIYTAA